MPVADYFKVSFKKPELSESTAQILEKKAKLKSQLESCYSRLETIEICNSNSKSSDALILSNFLIADIANLALSYFNKPAILYSDNWLEKIKVISEEDVVSSFNNYNLTLGSAYKTEEERSEKIETSLADLLYSIEKFIFKKNKAQFANPVDDFKKKSTVQAVVSLIVIILLLNAGSKQFAKLKPMKNDTAKIFFMNEQAPTPVAANTVTAEVKPSEEWMDVSFVFPKPTDIKDIKVEPLHQNFARMQLKEIKYLDESKNVLKERNFQLSKIGMIENTDTNEICCTEDLKPGKLIPGKYFEVESTSATPAFYIKMENTKAVKEIILTYRYIKNSKKFAD